MLFPEKIPIERIEDYHTHYLGKTKTGLQFWGYFTFLWTIFPSDIQGDWKDYRNEFVILHLFDNEGNYIETKHWLEGTANEISDDRLDLKLNEIVAELGEVDFCDIEVKIFQTLIEGEVFGLIPQEESGFIELQPNSTIAFSEPWDGSYFT